MKVRVVKDGGFYNVEVKRWYWPFWIEVAFDSCEDRAIEKAKLRADPCSAVVWSSEASPCK